MVNTNLSKSKNVDNKNETEGKSVRLHIRMMETSTVIFSLFRHLCLSTFVFFFLLTFWLFYIFTFDQDCHKYPILRYNTTFHHFVHQKIPYPWGTHFVPHLGLWQRWAQDDLFCPVLSFPAPDLRPAEWQDRTGIVLSSCPAEQDSTDARRPHRPVLCSLLGYVSVLR